MLSLAVRPTGPHQVNLLSTDLNEYCFGAVSSPFILYTILHHHLQQYNTPLSCNIQANLYVDNIVSGCETEQQAIQYFEEARCRGP